MALLNHFHYRIFMYKHLHLCKCCGNFFIYNKLSCNKYLSSSSSSLSSTETECIENNKKLPPFPKPVNPIIEKFEKMLNDMSVKQGNDIEFTTNFGAVRFDSDVDFTSTFSSLNIEENSQNENNKTDLEGQSNYIEDQYFNRPILKSDGSDEVSAKETCHTGRDSDLNYIDDQYLNINTLRDEITTSSNFNPEIRPDISSLHYIDSQIDGLSNHSVKRTESETLDSTLTSCYSFEDSINENEDGNIILKTNENDGEKNIDREFLENQLLLMTEEGTKYLEELNKSKEIDKKSKLKTEGENSEEKKIQNFDEQESQLEHENVISKESDSSNVKSAYAYKYVMEKRKEEMISSKKEIQGEILEHQRYKKIILAVPSYSLHTTYDMARELKSNIIYNKDDIVGISKPYGIPVHGGGTKAHDRLNIVNLLPTVAELIKTEKLEPIHRLDMNVTGVMLLAKTDEMAEKLKRLFKENKVRKSYLAIVKGVPDPFNGVIDIPIGEGKVDRYERMVLRPDIPNFRAKPGRSKKAITRYKVISSVPGAALLQLNPITGIKHQIRVHLGFGINCPVMGDHKYSYLTKIAPQKLPSYALKMFGMEQPKVRALPMFLHSFGVTLPIVNDEGREIFMRAVPPKHFRMAMQALKLSSRRHRIDNKYSDIIFGYE